MVFYVYYKMIVPRYDRVALPKKIYPAVVVALPNTRYRNLFGIALNNALGIALLQYRNMRLLACNYT
mgnify:CR=1 FL=1